MDTDDSSNEVPSLSDTATAARQIAVRHHLVSLRTAERVVEEIRFLLK